MVSSRGVADERWGGIEAVVRMRFERFERMRGVGNVVIKEWTMMREDEGSHLASISDDTRVVVKGCAADKATRSRHRTRAIRLADVETQGCVEIATQCEVEV